MAGVLGSDFHRWTYLQRRAFTDMMTPEERAYLEQQALHAVELAEAGREVEWYCAEAGYPLPDGVALPPIGNFRRIPFDASTKWAVAFAAGGKRGQIVTVRCPRCDCAGEINWEASDPRFIGLHIDHVIPVSRGGTNHPGNLRLLCPRCNIRRGNREVA